VTQKEVWRVQEAYFEARTKGNKDGFMKYFHKDCILLLSIYSIFLNKPEIKDRFPARIRSPKLKPCLSGYCTHTLFMLSRFVRR
jgi:hypothetical protein